MSRKSSGFEREIAPDFKYNDVLVAMFVNQFMLSGKKSITQKFVYEAMEMAQEKTSVPALDLVHQVVQKVQPTIEVKSRRFGGATYQVPVEVRPRRQRLLAIKWVRDASRKRPGKSMSEKLCAEFVDIHNDRGSSIKKRDDVHKMAEANRAFAHFRF